MVLFLRTNLIILLVFVAITNIDCRHGGRGRVGHVRASKLMKNKLHSNRQSSSIHKSNNHLLVSGVVGGSAGLLVGTLALRSFVSNNNKSSYRLLTNGTGSLCINRANYSNFIFNEFRCPLLPIFTTNDRYCCGAFHQQYCCSFWESGSRGTGAIIGIISACSLLILIIIFCIIYYRRYLKRKGINDRINIEQPPIEKMIG